VSLASSSLPARWAALIGLSILLAAVLERVHLPAALMLGSLLSGIILQSNGAALRVPALPLSAAQAVIGCLIARSFTAPILVEFSRQWPLFISVVCAVIAASCLLGWLVSRLGLIRGSTAVWGLLPGAAPAMMLMAEAFGADFRLVAFMQYLRVVLVAALASLIARFWVHVPAGHVTATVWFAPLDALAFSETVGIMLVAILAARFSRMPAGILIISMVLGAVLQLTGLVHIELPPWLLAGSYFCLGWMTGLRFTREVLSSAAHALPQTIISLLALILFCIGLAFLLVKVLGTDPLTAYLATSPGGADSVAIIATSSKVDVPFVMALQSVRFLIVLAVGPPLSRWVANRLVKDELREGSHPVSAAAPPHSHVRTQSSNRRPS
jgi:membrane AbrB-like protein